MKTYGILVSFVLLSTALRATPPTPKIYFVDDSGAILSSSNLTGNAPYQIHVSALPGIPSSSCFWDPTQWRIDGEHNVCQFDKSSLSQKNLPATFAVKYFSTDPSRLSHPQNVEDSNSQACFVQPGITFDGATNQLIADISQCINNRNQSYSDAASKDILGGGSLLESTFQWDFGDAGSAYNQVNGFNAGHIYSTTGVKKIALTITNETGQSGSTSLSLTVQPDNRALLSINSDADVSKIMNVNKGSPLGRKILFKSGLTYHIPNTINLFKNDWLTSDAGTLPILIPVGPTVFSSGGNARTLVENVSVLPSTSQGGWLAAGSGNNQAYRNIPFSNLHGGFNLAGSGITIQNVGMPRKADGSWVSNHIKGNFLIHTSQLLSVYGNHAYLEQNDGNSEPALRANGGNFISMIDNDIGGYTGKMDQVSARGTKIFYFAGNRLRGGLMNLQQGTSQDPQPAAMPHTFVIENNIFENAHLETSGGVVKVAIKNNLFHTHAQSDVAFNALYPSQSANHLILSGGPTNGVMSDTMLIENNAFQMDDNGRIITFYGAPTNVDLTNNRFLSLLRVPMNLNSATILYRRAEKNIYYLNAGVGIADLSSGTKLFSAWNGAKLASGNIINDQLALPSTALKTNNELAVPTPTPSPVVTKTMDCASWSFKPATCATGMIAKTITLLTDVSGGYCKVGNYSLLSNSISVINGCRGSFKISGS